MRLFFITMLSVLACIVAMAAFGSESISKPAVLDATACPTTAIRIFGGPFEPLVAPKGDTVIDVEVGTVEGDETPLDAILDELLWQGITLGPGGAVIYGPIHQNLGKDRCIVEGRDA